MYFIYIYIYTAIYAYIFILYIKYTLACCMDKRQLTRIVGHVSTTFCCCTAIKFATSTNASCLRCRRRCCYYCFRYSGRAIRCSAQTISHILLGSLYSYYLPAAAHSATQHTNAAQHRVAYTTKCLFMTVQHNNFH